MVSDSNLSRKEVLRTLIIYGSGSFLQGGLIFFLLPLYLRYFSPAEYGTIAILTITQSLMTMVLSIGVYAVIARLYYHRSPQERREVVGTVIIWALLAGFIGSLLLWHSASMLSRLINSDEGLTLYFRLLGGCFFFSIIRDLPGVLFRLENRAPSFVLITLVSFFLDFFLKILFIAGLERSIEGYLESTILSSAILVIISTPYILPLASFTVKLTGLRELFVIGSPFIVSGLSIWLLDFSDRLIVEYYLGSYSVGIFSLAFTLASVFTAILSKPVGLMIDPLIFSQANSTDNKIESLLKQTLIYSLYAGGGIYLMISLCFNEVLLLMAQFVSIDEDYFSALALVPILTLVPFIYFLSNPPIILLLWAKRPIFISFSIAGAAIINVFLNFLLIPRFAISGAAYASVVAYSLQCVALYLAAAIHIKVTYPWRAVSRACLILCLTVLICSFVSIENLLISLLIKLLIILIIFYGGVWKYTQLIDMTDKITISEWLKCQFINLKNRYSYFS